MAGYALAVFRRPGPVRRAALAAAVTWAAGFGALACFSASTPRDPAVRGLFDYLSATWGDGVLLPVSMGALVYANEVLPPTSRDRLTTSVGAVCGALAGATTQIQWLADDHPELNWTLPAPHQFNAAGVYHAVFLTAASAAFAGMWVRVLARMVASGACPSRRVSGRAIALAAMCGIGFVSLLVLDSQSSMTTRATKSTVVAIAGATIADLVGLAISSRPWRRSGERR